MVYIKLESVSRCSHDEDYILRLLQDVKEDRDFSIKKNAIEMLGRTGDVRAVEALKHLLIDKSKKSDRLRWRAARALGEIADQSAIDILSEALDDENIVVRLEAVVALGEIGGAATISSIMNSLSDESYYVRRRAAQVLIRSTGIPQPSPRNLEYLIKLLCSGEDRVMEAIIKIGLSALAPLITAFEDNSFFVRRDVAQTLALYIRRIIDDRPKGSDLAFCLAKHNFSLKSIAGLFEFRIIREDRLVKRIETTNFEMISKRLSGRKIIELSSGISQRLEPTRPFREMETKRIVLKNILSERGADHLELRGRTLTANVGKDYLGIKLGVRHDDGAKLLIESRIQNYLDQHYADLNLSSRLPRPWMPEKCRCYLFRLSGIPLALRRKLKLSFDTLAICYLADGDYFTYLNDPTLSIDEIKTGLALCSRDLAKLIERGIIHTSLISLFHNREQINTRSDRGAYRWWSKVAGRLDRWRESCQYPNLRLSGIADFEHIETHSALSPEDLQHLIGDHLFSISLVLSSYFRNRGEFDQRAASKILKDCFLTYHRELTHANHPIDDCIDWDQLAFRMSEEMEGDKYMKVIIRGGGSHGEDVEVSNGPHLGIFNGPFPIPELIRAIHITSLFAVLEMQNSPFHSK